MVVNARQKGRRGELEVQKLLQNALETTVPLNYAQAAAGGFDMQAGGWAIEVKRAENIKMRQWQSQALDSAWKHGLMPCLWYRQSYKEWAIRFPILAFLMVWTENPVTSWSQSDWLEVDVNAAIATIKRTHLVGLATRGH